MTDASQTLLELLRYALWRSPLDTKELPPKEYRELMKLAQAQTVWGLVAQSLVDAGVRTDDDCAMDTLEGVTLHQRSAGKMNAALNGLTTMLEEHGIRYAVFKGQVVAALYRQPAMRTCGDIDFYVLPEDFDHAVKLIGEELGVVVHEDFTDKHFDFEYCGVRFEMHYKIETFGSSAHQRLFDRWHDKALKESPAVYREVGGNKVRVLPTEIEIVTVFKHLFNHLLVEGVGLRQFVDLAVLLQVHSVDKEQAGLIVDRLKQLGYLRAFQTVVLVLQTYLGLEVDSRWGINAERDRKFADRIFHAVMKQGNFGRSGRKVQVDSAEKSMETLKIAMRHCMEYFWLAPSDIIRLIPKRVGISMKKCLKNK